MGSNPLWPAINHSDCDCSQFSTEGLVEAATGLVIRRYLAHTLSIMSQSVLVVDDDDIFRGFLCTVLRKAGYQIFETGNGTKAVALFREHRPDLVLTDLLMPGRDGMEVLRDIRAIDPEARVIIISGGGDVVPVGFLDLAPKMGAAATLTKPFDHRQLLAVVQKVLPREASDDSASGNGHVA